MNLLIALSCIALAGIGILEVGRGLESLHPALERIWFGYVFIAVSKGVLSMINEDKKK